MNDSIDRVVFNEKSSSRFFHNSELMEVRCWVYWNQGVPEIYKEKKENTEEIVFKFEKMSEGMWSYIEDHMTDCSEENGLSVNMTYNFNKFRAFIVKHLLKEWNLEIYLERLQNGELTDECYKRVMGVHARIMSYCLGEYENSVFLSDNDKTRIATQSAMLFNVMGKGVSNPHEAISLYCNLSLFWDKFGLNYFDIQKLPHEVFVYLKMVSGYESDFRNKEHKAQQNKSRAKGGKQRIA